MCVHMFRNSPDGATATWEECSTLCRHSVQWDAMWKLVVANRLQNVCVVPLPTLGIMLVQLLLEWSCLLAFSRRFVTDVVLELSMFLQRSDEDCKLICFAALLLISTPIRLIKIKSATQHLSGFKRSFSLEPISPLHWWHWGNILRTTSHYQSDALFNVMSIAIVSTGMLVLVIVLFPLSTICTQNVRLEMNKKGV